MHGCTKYPIQTAGDLDLAVRYEPPFLTPENAAMIRDRVRTVKGALGESYKELGARLVEPFSPPPLDADLRKAKETVGGAYVIVGGVDQVNVLQKGSVDDVKRATERTIRAGKPGGDRLIAPDGREIPGVLRIGAGTSRSVSRWNDVSDVQFEVEKGAASEE